MTKRRHFRVDPWRYGITRPLLRAAKTPPRAPDPPAHPRHPSTRTLEPPDNFPASSSTPPHSPDGKVLERWLPISVLCGSTTNASGRWLSSPTHPWETSRSTWHHPRGLRAAGLHRAAGRGKPITSDPRTSAERHRAMTCAQRLKRVFGIEIETCEACVGTVRVIASIEDTEVIGRILRHLESRARPAVIDGSERPLRSPGSRRSIHVQLLPE